MNAFTIKDLENFSGIKAHTIRTWEQRFTFLAPQRSDKLRRTYTLDELRLVLDVSFLNHNGYKVSQIAVMDHIAIQHAAAEFSRPQQLQEQAVNDLIFHMAIMDIGAFEGLLYKAVQRWGIDAVLTQVVVPFAEKTGLFTDAAPRHYKPNLLLIEQSIRNRIILGIDETLAPGRGTKALFYLAKRSSELELLYLQFQLNQRGFDTICVAGSVAATQLAAVANSIEPAFVLTSLPERANAFDVTGFTDFLTKHLPQTVVVNLSGDGARKFYPENIVSVTSRGAALSMVTKELQEV